MENNNQGYVCLSVVIPAYNEEKKIAEDVRAVMDFLNNQQYSFEVIIVDDGSRDGMLNILKDLQKQHRNLEVITYTPNQGKGYAVKQGVHKAKGEYVLFADAGLCVPYENVGKGLELLQQNFSVAIGSRQLAGSEIVVKQPVYRQLGARAFAWIVRRVMGIKNVSDTQCGFKLFTREAAKRIFKENVVKGFMFDVETILRAQKWGYHIAEFPVSWSNDPDTRFRPVGGSFRNFYELALIKIALKRKKKK